MEARSSVLSGVEFVAHVFMATIVFVLIGLVATGLGYFQNFLETRPDGIVPEFVRKTLHVIEYGTFTLDIILYCLYLGTMAISFAKSLKKTVS